MFIACVVVSVLLALMATASAVLKVQRDPRVQASMEAISLPEPWLNRLAAVELLGAAGVLIGLGVAPLGIASAIGFVVYFALAIGSHVRAKDLARAGGPAPFLLLSIAALVLRAATM